MSFPKSPTKRVHGALKLTIIPNGVEVTVGEEEESEGPDLSEKLEFSLPAGFSKKPAD